MSGLLTGLRSPDVRTYLLGQPPRRRKCTCVTATTTSVVVIIAVFGFTALNLHQNRFGSNQFSVHVGDEVAVSQFSDDLSATFCSAYEIQTWDRSQVYLLPSQAQVNTAQFRQEHFEISYVRDMTVWNSRGFYLLENSSVDVTGCRRHDSADAPAEMVLLKGDNFFHHWHTTRMRDRNELLRVEIPYGAFCNDSSSQNPRLSYTVTEADTYYVTLFERLSHSRGRLRSGDVLLNGTLWRTSYDVSGAMDECTGRFTICRFSLDFDDDDLDVVIRIHDNHVTPMSRSSVSTRCQARVLFWVGIFGGIPLVLVAITVPVSVWVFCVKLPAPERAAAQRPRSTTVTSQEDRRMTSREADVPGHVGNYNYSAVRQTDPVLSTQEVTSS